MGWVSCSRYAFAAGIYLSPEPYFSWILCTVFVDDRKENVDAARALGFVAHHFRDPETLRKKLKKLGLLK